MDIMDKVTPISGDSKEFIPPYIGNGHSGRTLSLNRTEEVRGSNPPRSIHKPPYVGVYVFYPTYGELMRDTKAGMRSTMAR